MRPGNSVGFIRRLWGLALTGVEAALLALLAAVLASDSAFRRPRGGQHWPTARDGDWSGVFGDTIEAARWCSMASNGGCWIEMSLGFLWGFVIHRSEANVNSAI